MKYLALVMVLTLGGCAAPLQEITHDAAHEVDEGARKLQAAISQIRKNVQPYAAVAVQLCKGAPVSADLCAALDEAAEAVVSALDEAQAALDLYNAGKGDFIDAYEAVVNAVELASDYAEKVVQLHDRSRA